MLINKQRIKHLLKTKAFFRESLNWLRYLRNISRYSKNPHFDYNGVLEYRNITLNNYANTFCGYYDISPFQNSSSSKILIHANNHSIKKLPDGRSETDIILFDFNENRVIKKAGSTRAWNWQQGARTGWLSQDKIIYNEFTNNQYHGVIVDIGSNEKHLLKNAVQCWSRKYYTTLSYELLSERRPDYGYFCHHKLSSVNDAYIRVLDIETDSPVYEISWSEVLEKLGVSRTPEIISTIHFNHVQFSPCENKIAFLVRFNINGGQCSSFFVYDLIQQRLSIPVRNEIISHHTWRTPDELVYWGKYNGKFGYYRAMLEEKKSNIISLTQPDGHPTFISEKEFITDTYPDKTMRRRLYKGDLNGVFCQLAEFIEGPVFYVENRCDPHPSVNYDKCWIQIDRMNKGRRFVSLFQFDGNKCILGS